MNNLNSLGSGAKTLFRQGSAQRLLARLMVVVLAVGGPLEMNASEADHSEHGHHGHQPMPAALPQSRSPAPQELVPNPPAERVYTCAMHPQVRSTDPDGRCPICGMELIPVTGDASPPAQVDADNALILSERALALLDIRSEPVTRRALVAELSLPGRIAVDESLRRTISARIGGRLDRLYVNTTGERVEQGAPLAQLYSPELMVMQQELLQAAQLRQQAAQTPALAATAKGSYRAAREALRLLGLSAEAIDAIEKRGEVTEHLTIEAPLGGVVLQRLVSQGDYVRTGRPLYELADLTRVWAQLEAYETDLPHLKVGQAVQLRVTARPAETFTGKVVYIEPWVDEQRRTAQVRVNLDNAEGRLSPGMLARGTLLSPGEPALAIPASAPLLTGERALVYVRQIQGEETVFVPREVTLGAQAGGYYPVLEGLNEGDQVVVHGALRLDSERQIQGLSSMMSPEGGAPAVHDHGGAGAPQSPSPQESQQPAGGDHVH